MTEVIQSLNQLGNRELITLGTALGLQHSRLKRLSPESLCDEMVTSWLRRDDEVLRTSGEPSWESLATALEADGMNGIASDIRKVSI